MNENDGTRSFDTVQIDTQTTQKSPDKKPDLKKILTISIFATMTVIILLFCAIIITEVVYKIGGEVVNYKVESVPSSNSKLGELLIISKANRLDASAVAKAGAGIKNVYSYNTELKAKDPELAINYQNRDPNAISLLPEVIQALNSMTAALHSETGCGDILLDYGHLTPKDNTREIEYPHELGTTADLKLKIGNEAQELSANQTAYNWLANNAHKFGFVNSDPGNTEHNYDSIPSTQFRYIGVVHATYIHESDSVSTLEQYVNLLKASHNDPEKAITVEAGGKSYSVYYAVASSAENTEIKIPENCTYSVSGDNMGGLIVTVDLSGK